MMIFGASGILFLGCAHHLNIDVTDTGIHLKPLVESIPINVGVYYGNDFRLYKTTQENNYTQDVTRICNIQLGQANVALFDFILSHLFENVTSIEQLPNELEKAEHIDLIIEPKVSDYLYSERMVFYEPAVHVYLEYTINFYSPDGMQKSQWTIYGESSKYKTLHGVEVMRRHTSVEELTQISMRQIAAQFLTDFCNQDPIKSLFDKPCQQ